MYFLTFLPTDKVFMIYVLNVFIYSVTLVLLFTTLTFGSSKTYRTMNVMARVGTTGFFKFTLLVSFLSLSGLPPFLGFFGKFFLFFALTAKTNLWFVLAFLFFNLFALYFYLQSTRHLAQSSMQKTIKTLTPMRAFVTNGGWGVLTL